MLNSSVIEVAIGLAFCYASVALIASAIYEGVASWLGLRAKSLLAGVKSLLNDSDFNGLALDIYNDALVNPRGAGETGKGARPKTLPSYIEPRHFALALIDAIQNASGASATMKDGIDSVPNKQLRALLTGMYRRAEGKAEGVEVRLARWFDASMDRISGTYKRQAQLFTFLIGLGIAAALNIDSFRLFSVVWNHPSLVAQITVPASPNASAALTGLMQLPVGWQSVPSVEALLLALGGWVVTAFATIFGAPFWFGLLQRLVNVRGTGKRPADKEIDTW